MRRSFLKGAAALAVIAISPRAASAASARRIILHHAATGARFAGTWHNGVAPDPRAMADLSAVLADSHDTAPKPFDPVAIEILWHVMQRAGMGHEVTVRSGYRTPQVNRMVRGVADSQHLRAAAMDVEVPAGRIPAFAQAALALKLGGVGVYQRRGFVHLDSGPPRHWAQQTPGRTRLNTQLDDRIGTIAEAWRAASAPR
jgi:uncharacterized protein YcbK (DUF882 family)